ncbi:hypothetical protein KKH18_06865 [bacterium]|nr:hypothetical protein [bacterium]
MDARKFAEFDRKIAAAHCLREDIVAACRSLHIAAQRIERGDFTDLDSLANHYQFIVETQAELAAKLQKLALASGATSVVPVSGNGKVEFASPDPANR